MIRSASPILAAMLAAAVPATAQVAPSAGVEATTDEVRRGISWSQGRVSASGDASLTMGAIDASARVVALRGSRRQAGADAVADVAIGTGWDLGAIRVRASAIGHLFAGTRADMDYAEIGGSGSYTYGPLQLTGGAIYAPSQDAIGGSNLYLYVNANAGIPATPLTVVAQVGRSSGSIDDPVRSQRLRPGGGYLDWRLSVEHQSGPVMLAVDYVGTDIARAQALGMFADPGHAGDKLLGRVWLGF